VNLIECANGSLRICAGQGPGKEHTISRLKITAIRPNSHDHPRTISSWCVRKRRLSRVGSRANVSFNWVYSDSPDLNENLSGGDLQVGNLDQLQDLRFAKLFDANRLHRASIDLSRGVAIRATSDTKNTCQTRCDGPKIKSPA
jgi:hypothetical protein